MPKSETALSRAYGDSEDYSDLGSEWASQVHEPDTIYGAAVYAIRQVQA